MIDDALVPYTAIKLNNLSNCENLSGRYYIRVDFIPDGQLHKIICRIKDYITSDKDDIESGENLELKSFYKNECKLSIGMEGDAGYYPDGQRVGQYDYDNDYYNDGVGYIIFPNTITESYIFGIAWIENVNDENINQTWFGADPFYITASNS